MSGLDLGRDLQVATLMLIIALVVVALNLIVYVSKVLPVRRRNYFRASSRSDGFEQGVDLADPGQQLNSVIAATFEKRRVLSSSEYRAFKIVEESVVSARRGYRVFAQTSLGEVLESSSSNAFHSINSKRVDILVVDRGGWPVLAVEYQGSGHYQGKAAARDAVKKEALRKAGVRYLEVFPTDADEQIRSRVCEQLGWSSAASTDDEGSSRTKNFSAPNFDRSRV